MTAPNPVADRIRQLTAQTGPLKAVERATVAREKAEARLAELTDAWQTSIADAKAAGCAVQDVAAAAKVHRSRVWQLGREHAPAAAAQ